MNCSFQELKQPVSIDCFSEEFSIAALRILDTVTKPRHVVRPVILQGPLTCKVLATLTSGHALYLCTAYTKTAGFSSFPRFEINLFQKSHILIVQLFNTTFSSLSFAVKMTTQSPLSSQSSKLSPNIVLHDISTVLPTTSESARLREGLLFISTPLHLGTRTDHDYLREELKIRTFVSTLHPKTPRYIRGPVLGTFVVQQYIMEDVLGLKACHLLLRHGKDFIQNAIDKLPMRSRLSVMSFGFVTQQPKTNDQSHVHRKFQNDARNTGKSISPELAQKAQEIIWNRDSIDESFAILTTSAPLIGRVINDVLCDATSYPLIISGDFMLRDSGILMFLVLLLLEVPLTAIENAYVRIAEDFALRCKEMGVKDTLINDARAANRQHWARELSRRLIAKYGSTSAYLDLAGVSGAKRTKIKDILLVSEEKTLIDIV
jgi:hypothetical protein